MQRKILRWAGGGRVAALVLCAALLAGCAETEFFSHAAKVLTHDDSGVGGPHSSAPVPDGYKLGKPYEVYGVTYYPYHDPNFAEQGVASWYGDEFHGRLTANGEPFDMNSLTAAHKTLPLPSTVRVTNLENGRSLLVRVNDRGPFVNGRIIDLSRRSAQLLGVYGKGTAKVRVEFVQLASLEGSSTVVANDASPSKPRHASSRPISVASIDAPSRTPGPVAKPTRPRGGLISSADAAEPDAAMLARSPRESDLFIQVGAFASRDNADRLRGQLAGLGRTTVSPGNFDGRVLHRVRLGPLASVEVADSLLDRLIRSGYTSARLIVETN